MIPLYQQRDFGEKINATFTYAGQQFRSLGIALLYISGPVALLAGITGGIYQSNLLKVVRVNPDNPFAAFENIFSPTYLLMSVFAVLSRVLVSLTVYAHLKVYSRNQGGPVPIGEVWQEVQAALWQSLGFSLISGLLIVVGFLFLIVPGVYISVPLSLGLAVIAFEGVGLMEAISRCFTLIQNKWWSTLGLIFVMILIVAITGLAFSLPAGVLTILKTMRVAPELPEFVPIAAQTIAMVGGTLLSALVALAVGFQYFNLVERQEGTGLLSAIDQIGTPPPIPRAQDEGDY